MFRQILAFLSFCTFPDCFPDVSQDWSKDVGTLLIPFYCSLYVIV